jgi:hypothetical protein
MLARIPFWGWLLIILTALYLIYNPLGFSLVHMWSMPAYSDLLPFKILATLAVGSVLGLVVYGVSRTVSKLGLMLMLAITATLLWCAWALLTFDVLNLHMWAWIGQPILAVILTLGWQWPKIWRRSTGAVTVDDPDTGA